VSPSLTNALPLTAARIHCQSLTLQFSHGVRAVDDIELIAPAGQILALIGSSGCGKTSLLRLMAGLVNPTAGSVTMEPPAISQQGQLAFVFQQATLLPWRTAVENVCLPLELIGQGGKRERSEVAEEMLRTVGLADAFGRLPQELSGGMKMRVSIARALVTRPSVLLLDEPFAALDDMLRNQLGELLLQLWQQQRFTVVMVTHNVGEAILLSHRVAVMRSGKINNLIENPLPWPRNETTRATPEFAKFYGQVSQSLRSQVSPIE
jgi:NitT/TauT family transport system ATP-binding protein